ncbi:TRP-interacting helix [Popillia japonica]|uniref:TRP-interacting helix n=1 Tax=Popillia japonica TaxID=7064 RepID=A0AAW1N3Y6_POPJA
MAAILLSIYYIFMWDGQPNLARRTDPSMQHRIGLRDYDYPDIQRQDIENTTKADYYVMNVSPKKNESSIDSMAVENFTNNPNVYNHIPLSIDNMNEINIINKENEVSSK